MKKLFVILFLVSACTQTTMITGSWKSQTAQSKNYKSILVAALTNRAVAKSTVESDIATLLGNYGVTASKGIDVFPPTITNTDSNRIELMDKIKGKNVDAILTISLLKKETESRYIDSRLPYDPYGNYLHYRNFWGYYSYWYPGLYDPAYDLQRIYYIESNLYDATTEELVWSAQSRTYDMLDLATFSKEFASSIVRQMKEDGILKGDSKAEPEDHDAIY